MEEKKNDYAMKEQVGNIVGIVWLNESKFGKPWHTIKFTRAYKDKDGQWGNATSFRCHDLPCLLEVLLRTVNWFRSQVEADVQDPVPTHAMEEKNVVNTGRKKRRAK